MKGKGVIHRMLPTRVARVAMLVAFAFASSLSVSADDQTQVVTLAQLVAQALAEGPDIRLSQADVAAAQAQFASAAAKNALGLGAGAGASRSDTLAAANLSDTLAGSQPATDSIQGDLTLTAPLSTRVGLSAAHRIAELTPLSHSTSLSLSVSSTLWDGYPGGSGLASVKQAEISLQGKLSSAEANRKNIVYKVTQAYYTLLGAQHQVSILEQTLLKRQEELKKTQALFSASRATQVEVKQAQINQAQAELDLSSAKDDREIAREKLSALAGWPIARLYAVAGTEDLPASAPEVAEAVKSALAQRSDMTQNVLSQASGEIALALAKSQSSPTVSANGSLTFTRDWTADANKTDWSAGLQVSVPILDAGAADAQVKQAALQRETLKIQQEQLAASIATQVKNAVYGLRDLLARVALAQASLELAQDQYDLAKIQFDNGANTNFDVLSASVALSTAQVNLARARSDAQLGALALQNAMGN